MTKPMTEMRKQTVPFTDVAKNFVEIFGVALIASLILSYVFKMDLNKPGTFNGVLGSHVG